MKTLSPSNPPAWLSLDRNAGDLEGQVYRGIRDRILSGQIGPGHRVPSTRALASSLGIARSTVVGAYERLKAEGFLKAATGSGCRVAALSMSALTTSRERPVSASAAAPQSHPMMLEPGVPDLEDFPRATWARYLGGRARNMRVLELGYGEAGGVANLREAIVEHLSAIRGVVAHPDQVVILPSTRTAIDLLAFLQLRTSGNSVAWVEEPGYASAKALLTAAGARIVPVPCDEAGIDVTRAEGPPPGLVYVTPSHQYPTGATMSLQRRLALLELAHKSGALILEDDYDSDFQYGSRPIAALQGIDRHATVAYLGTFSKILAPGIRVAYAVLPRWLLPQAVETLRLRGIAVPVHIQAALADFIRDGRLRAYLRQRNTRYAERMHATREALSNRCGHLLSLESGSGGLQLASWFHDGSTDDTAVVRKLHDKGIAPQAMSRFFEGRPRPGLLFGIARSLPESAEKVAQTIADVLEKD